MVQLRQWLEPNDALFAKQHPGYYLDADCVLPIALVATEERLNVNLFARGADRDAIYAAEYEHFMACLNEDWPVTLLDGAVVRRRFVAEKVVEKGSIVGHHASACWRLSSEAWAPNWSDAVDIWQIHII